MFSKFSTKLLRPLGLFLILSLSVLSIFFSLFFQDLRPDTFLGKIVDYSLSLDNRFYDYRLKETMDPLYRSKNTVFVSIDDYSLQKIGTWPLPRTVHAKMLRKLKSFGAKVVGLDIMFPEKAPVCGEVSPDAELAQAISEFQEDGSKVFMGYTLAPSYDPNTFKEVPDALFNDMLATKVTSGATPISYKVAKYTFPTQEILNSGISLGHINMDEDSDGIFRRYHLMANLGDIDVGSLGLNVYLNHTQEKPEIIVNKDGSSFLEVRNKRLRLNSGGKTQIRYFGGREQFPTVSLYTLINADDQDQKMQQLFQGKMVFVGSTALGAHDLRPSPIDPKMPGVFGHINIAEMLTHQYFFRPIDLSVKISIGLLLLGTLLILLFQRLKSAVVDLVVLMSIIGSIYLADKNYFMPEGFELKLFYCFFCFILSYSWCTFLNFMEASKEKKQIKGTFARYVAPTIVDEMLEDPNKLVVGGFRRDITCLFSDVRDFTSISEGLSATELAHSLNIYMGKMTDIVFETKGTLDKYIGDAIVAFWGAPLEIGNHAQFAVEGAIRMMNELPAINEEFKKLGRPEFKVGIGLNSGECNVGNMGSSRIFSYTALGDNMNLGARLESLCKHYGVQILISEYTLSRLETTNIKYRPIDKVIVKGKTKPVEIFEVLHDHHPMTHDPEAFEFYQTAYQMFQKKNFRGAMEIFEQILMGIESDKPSRRLKELCKKYLENPELVDDKFDVTKMTEK